MNTQEQSHHTEVKKNMFIELGTEWQGLINITFYQLCYFVQIQYTCHYILLLR